jgi:uncharacterized protein YndB with AHSA1/START domain
VIEPLRINLRVECGTEHAFRVWTERATAWWPPEHTASHEPGAKIVFEPRAGGRIYERTPGGDEIEWGRVTAWEPPSRIAYTWHIAAAPADATDVEIHFRPAAGGATEVSIEHAGWERLGDWGPAWRDANIGGWNGVLPAYLASCASASATS